MAQTAPSTPPVSSTMPLANLAPADLALTIAPQSLGFKDTSELRQQPLPWIGQARAKTAARFGLSMAQPDYNLFVLGEVGSGRSSLLQQLSKEVAAARPVPPDLCYLHNFDAPEQPHALRLPPGQGRLLRQLMGQLRKTLQKEIPQWLDGPDFKAAIARYLDKIRPTAHVKTEGLSNLSRQIIQPLLAQALQDIRLGLAKPFEDAVKLDNYLDQVMQDVLDNLDAFRASEVDEDLRLKDLATVLARLQVNLVVDNKGLTGAPVIIEDNPTHHSLFGSMAHQAEENVLQADFSGIRVGSLIKAHGGFLLLHVRDLLADPLLWEKLRRFSRTGRLQTEEPVQMFAPTATVLLAPEALDLSVKLVLIGTTDTYYQLQKADPELARHFRVKVDFATSFTASADTYAASAVFVAHTCQRLGLPHFTAAAVAHLLENAHREVDDQTRQSAIFADMEALVMEAAALAAGATLVDGDDVSAALQARRQRHNHLDQRMQEAISDGERLINLQGEKIGQINGLTQIDLGDYRFGFPVRVTARTSAGEDGLVNIEHRGALSSPAQGTGMQILHSYLSALFAAQAPLALDATLVFEQQRHGIEGDMATCAELYALLSCLSGLALRQGIAVAGTVNQHGEVLPVGGINEKIEGFFRICATAGLTGAQGVLIPEHNRRHLMLSREVTQAVAQGRFHVYAAAHVGEGLELLTGDVSGMPGMPGGYASATVLGRAQETLQAYRRACHLADHPKAGQKRKR